MIAARRTIVPVICKRYESALVSANETRNYFDQLSASVHDRLIMKWTTEIEAAELARRLHPEVMDIMGTSGEKRKCNMFISRFVTHIAYLIAKSRADVELDLMTGPAMGQTATIRWLMTGLTLEEDQ
jgi:hypothetical protein